MSGDVRMLRLVLAALAVAALDVGVTATVAPHAFYEHFPFDASWVRLLPPYNEHLVTDVGGLQLAFGLLFAYAALHPSPALVQPVAAAWALAQGLHVAFHVVHLEGFGTADAIGQTASLALLVVLAAEAVVLSRRGAAQLTSRSRVLHETPSPDPRPNPDRDPWVAGSRRG